MTPTEIHRAINEFNALYPNYYKNQSQAMMEQIARSWAKKYDNVQDYDAFIQALYEFERKSEFPNPPTTKQWLDLYRLQLNRKAGKKMKRRIVTDDEEKYNMYLEEMKKPPEKRNEWLLERLKPSVIIMTNPEEYKRKHGAYREEFEALD